MTASPSLTSIAAAVGIAYLLGSIPTAYLAGRLKGVDIFRTGSGQAGATNVWRNVSRRLAAVVFFSDSSKGMFALLSARWFGLQEGWLLLPGFAVVLAHWNSPWTKFRGGDGVATLTGIGLGLDPAAMGIPYSVIAAITIVGSLKGMWHPTLWGAITGYLLLLTISLLSPFAVGGVVVNFTQAEALGFTALGVAILVHSYVYRRRRRGKLANALIEAVQEEDIPAAVIQPPAPAEDTSYKEKRA